MVGSDCRSFPASVVAGRISRVQLEPVMLIIASKQESRPKRPGPSNLRIVLLDITDMHNKLLNRHTSPKLNPIILSIETLHT